MKSYVVQLKEDDIIHLFVDPANSMILWSTRNSQMADEYEEILKSKGTRYARSIYK